MITRFKICRWTFQTRAAADNLPRIAVIAAGLREPHLNYERTDTAAKYAQKCDGITPEGHLCQNESNCKSSGDSRIENKAAPKRNNPLGQVHCCCRFRRRHLKRCRPKSASGNCEHSRHYFGPKNGLGSAKNLLGSNHRRAQAAKRGQQYSHRCCSSSTKTLDEAHENQRFH